MTNLLFSVLVFLFLMPLAFFATAEKPPCCVCFDYCASTITIPNAVVVLPPLAAAFTGSDSATCAQLLDIAEIQMLIPAMYCNLFDREDFR